MRTYKLLLTSFLFVTFFCNQSTAQIIGEGKSVASLGYGIPNWSKVFYPVTTDTAKRNFTAKGMGPIHLKYEYMFSDEISVGVSVNIATLNASYIRSVDSFLFGKTYYQETKYSLKATNYSVLLRVNYHFSMDDEKLDLYAGAGIGYRGAKRKITSEPFDVSYKINAAFPLGFEATFGARYLFTEQIGGYAEVGLGKSLLQIGACYVLGKD